MNRRKISESTVRRLSLYLRLLREVRSEGTRLLSSRELAARTGTTSAQVRKDLSFFGSFGKRGRGYDVDELELGHHASGVPVWPLDQLEEVVRSQEVTIGIIATPPAAAEDTARRLPDTGVSAILNFAPVKLTTPDTVTVRTMDVALELEGLSFALTSERGNGSP